ncbi:MAG: hypothetical protein IJO16_07460 [Clostridia bacterium]|nr:hypothetical protein [Clostridia bacterium]
MKKKIMAMCLVIAMAATAVIGGTLAYFTDSDAKTNTFTVGNVDIHIDEWMKNEKGEWVEYADQKLFPIDNGKITNNKLVETVNDGSEDAYIRTFVTCPKDMYDYLGLGFNSGANSQVVTNEDGTKMYNVTWKDVGTFNINNEKTAVFLCEVADKCEVAKGDSVLSLTTVWLYKNVTNELIESWNLEDGKFPVEVVSQAIQSENLTYDEAMAELGAIDQDLMDKLFND